MWHELLAAAFAMIVVCWIAALALKRWTPRTASALQIAAGLVGRIAIGGVFVAIAVDAAGKGSYWLLLAIAFSALALVSFGLFGLTLFVIVREAAPPRSDQAP
jgi:hypothetical protein